ncbi:MAG: polyribonucleotide nucleotidyltransferase [Sedimentisphaeraceae bacterium JB056]
MNKITKVEREIAGQMLTIETGRIANQADGAVIVTYGETMLLASACGGEAREGIDFFPLSVDYRERQVAAGKFPGGFMKREGRPSSREILIARCIDRPIRPLFPADYFEEVQIMVNVLSADKENDPDVLAIIASSAALCISSIPFQGPLAACKLGRIDGKFVAFPTRSQMENSDLNLMLGGRKEEINMIEVAAKQIKEDAMSEAVLEAHKWIGEVCDMITELQSKCGKEKVCVLRELDPELNKEVKELVEQRMIDAKHIDAKLERNAAMKAISNEMIEKYCECEEPRSTVSDMKRMLDRIEEEVVRKLIRSGRRPDGRDYDTVRPLSCEVGLIPRVHGSALFSRGETQALISIILGTGRDEQIIDGIHDEFGQNFMLHYNFPPYSVGEVRPVRGPGRREIGHGALAEKALEAVAPSSEDFPYTIKVVSDITGSNGSSSMASVCGGTLALLDAGVPMEKPVAGISVGMVSDENGYQLITDILGEEDHFGDMDFKVAGTEDGITAIQLDLKAQGLPHSILVETLERARKARLQILETMGQAIDAPRTDLSKYAPKLTSIYIDPEFIGKLIGPGGATIKRIQEETGTVIEISDDGKVVISCSEGNGDKEAYSIIEAMTAKPELGALYPNAKVVSIKDFGVFVEIAPGVEGLCHISELSDGFVKDASKICKVGDIMPVKLYEIDKMGRIKFSRKKALEELDGQEGKEDSNE